MTRKISPAALTPLVLAACVDAPLGPSSTSENSPAFELVDPRQVMDVKRANVDVFGTFQVLSGTPPRVLGAGGTPESANFPGHPPLGPGTCLDGRWYNARGHATSGSMENPHPHCFDPGTDGITIVLEPISSQLIGPTEAGRTTLVLSNQDDVYIHHDPKSECFERPCYQEGGWGSVAGYAVNAATNQRVGILKFELTPLPVDPRFDPFACSLEGDPIQNGCINFIYTASYSPLPAEQGGQGTAQKVSGFVYWLLAR